MTATRRSATLLSLLVLAAAPALAVQASAQVGTCVSSLAVRGNPLTGRTLTVTQEVPGMAPAQAFDALKAGLEGAPEEVIPKITFASADPNRGVLTGQLLPKGAARPVQLQAGVVGLPSGATQVTVSNRFPAAMLADSRAWAESFCTVLASLAGGGSTVIAAAPGAGPLRPVPAEVRGCRPQAHTLGTRIQGELSVSDCRADQPNDKPADVYQFTTAEQRDIMVALESPGNDTRFRLLSEDGELLTEQVTGRYSVLRTQIAPGTYNLVVYHSMLESPPYTGRYTLTSSTDQAGFGGCLATTPLPASPRVQGTWSVSDCKYQESNSGFSFADFYLLKIDQTREVTIGGTSPTGQPTIHIASRDGTVLSTRDYSGNAVIANAVLEPGEYIVIAAAPESHSRNVTGSYTLSVR